MFSWIGCFLFYKNVLILDISILDQWISSHKSIPFLLEKCKIICTDFLLWSVLIHFYIELVIFSEEIYNSLEICYIFQYNLTLENIFILNVFVKHPADLLPGILRGTNSREKFLNRNWSIQFFLSSTKFLLTGKKLTNSRTW